MSKIPLTAAEVFTLGTGILATGDWDTAWARINDVCGFSTWTHQISYLMTSHIIPFFAFSFPALLKANEDNWQIELAEFERLYGNSITVDVAHLRAGLAEVSA